MPKEIEAIYDPSEAWRPVEEGQYPAHVMSLSTREVNTRAGEAIVVNMEYKIASEVSNCTQEIFEMDGYNYVKSSDGGRVNILDGDGSPSISNCSHLKDKRYKDNGFFVFLQSSSGSKNAKYFELLDYLGIECTTAKIDGKKVKQLVLLEESDVIGKPVIVNLKRETFVTAATKHLPPHEQEKRSTFKVSTVKTWEDGETIIPEEDDVPF